MVAWPMGARCLRTTFAQGAALGVPAAAVIARWCCAHLAGETVLVHGASGAVVTAVQLARALG